MVVKYTVKEEKILKNITCVLAVFGILVLFFSLPYFFIPSYPQKYTGKVKILMNDLPGRITYYNKHGKFYYVRYADKVGHVSTIKLEEEDLTVWDEK